MADDLVSELARMHARSDALAETETLPRGALPGLFRALAAACADEQQAAAKPLCERLPDWPLVAPSVAFVQSAGLEADYVAALPSVDERSAWASARQAAALSAVASAEWTLEALAWLIDPEQVDASALALAAGDVEGFCAAMREVLRLRLGVPARRRDRTSAQLALGALRALASAAPDEHVVQQVVKQVLAAETRRSPVGEPTLALAALDALEAAPALARMRLLEPLIPRLQRRKVKTSAEAVLARAHEELGLTPAERLDLLARDGEADADGWVSVDLEEGGVTRVRINAQGDLERDGEAPSRADERALQSAERALRSAWDELAARLEQALVTRRAWARPLWEELARGRHPLWIDLAGRLLWEQGSERRFALDEEGAPRDVFGDACELDDEAIRLAHPVLLDADELELWREFALGRPRRAPFAQLYRDVCAQQPNCCARFVGRQVKRDAIDDFARQGGWKGSPLLGTGPWELYRGETEIGLEAVVEEFKATLQQRRAAHRQAKEGQKAVVRRPKEVSPRAQVSRIEAGVPESALSDDQTSAEAESDQEELRAQRVAAAELVRELERLTERLALPDDLWVRGWQKRKWKDAAAAWKEIVLRYRQGSPAVLETRIALLRAFSADLGIELRIEDRFVITRATVIELGTGVCHQGPPKDHFPQWKVGEIVDERPALELRWPFRPETEPDTVEIVERVLHLALHDASEDQGGEDAAPS